MLLIWGWRVRLKVLDRQAFHCPSCGADRTGAHKQARRWFTLFFIPLVPLKVVGDFIVCETCDHAYDKAVLARPTSAVLATELMEATREAVATLLRIDDPIAARDAAVRALSEVAGREWSVEELDADITHNDASALSDRLHHLSQVMNEHGRERFLATAAGVAASGGSLLTDSRAALASMAQDLGMTPAHARGVIDQAVEAAQDLR